MKLGNRHAQVAERKSGEETSAAPTTPSQKEIVNVDSLHEPVVLVEKVSKMKESTEVAPEK